MNPIANVIRVTTIETQSNIVAKNPENITGVVQGTITIVGLNHPRFKKIRTTHACTTLTKINGKA